MSIIIPANSAVGGGYDVDNSVRFNGASSDDLTGTPSGTPTSRYKGTLSVWLKRSTIDAEDFIFYGLEGSANRMKITFLANNKLQINTIQAGSNNLVYETNRLFRDVSAWYHIVIAIDTTLGTAGDRCRLYVNGVEETSFSTETDFSQNAITFMSETNIPVYIGSQSTGNYYDGYMAEYVLIDGQQLAPTSFGEFDEDSGIWKPIDVSGLTFGTNGFYLDFENSGALGADVSGNTNNFTVNNLTAIDQSTDTCTTNFATMNPLAPANISSASEGNLKILQSSSGGSVISTFGFSSGKWYWEVELDSQVNYTQLAGVIKESKMESALLTSFNVGANDGGWGYFLQGNSDNGKAFHNNTASSAYTTMSAGNILSIAVDSDNGKIFFGVNGTWVNSGDPAAGSNEVYSGLPTDEIIFPAITNYVGDGSTATLLMNFGSPSYAISSGNVDSSGMGNFEYAVPSGYYSLCTRNLNLIG